MLFLSISRSSQCRFFCRTNHSVLPKRRFTIIVLCPRLQTPKLNFRYLVPELVSYAVYPNGIYYLRFEGICCFHLQDGNDRNM
jgi:hypothetical protein